MQVHTQFKVECNIKPVSMPFFTLNRQWNSLSGGSAQKGMKYGTRTVQWKRSWKISWAWSNRFNFGILKKRTFSFQMGCILDGWKYQTIKMEISHQIHMSKALDSTIYNNSIWIFGLILSLNGRKDFCSHFFKYFKPWNDINNIVPNV